MGNLLERIYMEIICYEEDAVRMENELAEEIDRLAAPYHKKVNKKQMAQFKAVLYEAASAAEVKAFWLGMRYASRLQGML